MERNCEGNIEKRLGDVGGMLLVARFIKEGTERITELVQFLKNRPKKVLDFDMFEKTYEGDVAKRLKDIREFMPRAKFTPEGYKTAMEVIPFLENCPKTDLGVGIYEKSCEGDIQKRLRDIREFMPRAKFTHEGYQAIKEVIAFLEGCSPSYQ